MPADKPASETQHSPDVLLLRMFNLALHCRKCIFLQNYGTYRVLSSTPCLASQLLRQSGQWHGAVHCAPWAAWCSNMHVENPYSSLGLFLFALQSSMPTTVMKDNKLIQTTALFSNCQIRHLFQKKGYLLGRMQWSNF